ncbi:MAG TPA: DUF4135 domain-containing protein, partial [Pyrinomonadaceae bacterium]|nr:DUF4135 domain-containing protein [Pyrinomonadaceae bacterium]
VVTRDILNRIAINFRANILLAVQRILNDRPQITQTFVPPGATLQGLQKIESTGSDFHKGGKQVLILTFYVHLTVQVSNQPIPYWWSSFNLIYKPSDLETDCLIAGDSAAVNAIHPAFQVKSLFEIFNDEITIALNNNPNLSLELLPTYKILPIAYSSNQPGNPLNIRRAYGYIEFLQHEHYNGPFNFYSWGSSDFKIFPKQNSAAICQKFYRLIGQITAIAAVFSISDLHAENLIVKNYLPYPIDLEISLSLPIGDIGDTVLYNATNKAGVNGWRKEDEFAWKEAKNNNNLLVINDTQTPKFAQNRLATVGNVLIDPSTTPLAKSNCKAFRDMIDIIQTANTPPHNNDLNTWIARVNNIVVRNLPMKTGEFRAILTGTVSKDSCADNTALGRFVDYQRGFLYQTWQGNVNGNPDFLALQNAYVLGDFNNGDIPIFYHRIPSLDIMDSNGNDVQSPGAFIYRATPTSPQQNQVYQLPAGRNTFFAAAPFTTNVVNGQLATITNPGTKAATVNQFLGEILNQMGLQNSPADINNILA